MGIKKTVKASYLISIVVLVAFLAGCSGHNNPLKVAKPTVAAKFLVNASQAAEKTLHIFNAPGGYYYGECMNNKAKKSLCTKFYKAMLDYANTTTQFRNITANDLIDKNVFMDLKKEYKREQFNAV